MKYITKEGCAASVSAYEDFSTPKKKWNIIKQYTKNSKKDKKNVRRS